LLQLAPADSFSPISSRGFTIQKMHIPSPSVSSDAIQSATVAVVCRAGRRRLRIRTLAGTGCHNRPGMAGTVVWRICLRTVRPGAWTPSDQGRRNRFFDGPSKTLMPAVCRPVHALARNNGQMTNAVIGGWIGRQHRKQQGSWVRLNPSLMFSSLEIEPPFPG
jgi:hypothetical protein